MTVRRILAVVAGLVLVACDDGERMSKDGGQDRAPAVQALDMPAPAPEAFSARGGTETGSVALSAAVAPRQGGPESPGESQVSSANDPSQQAMIIRTGHAAIEVDSLELAIAQVTQLAKRLGGQVAATAIETGRKDFRTAQMTLRIPSAQFDAALGGLDPIGKIESQNVSSEDVTEQYVDMTARMTNAKRLEDRLIALLANRTGKLEEVLAVERELARVREEIERYEGRLRYLRTRAAISTLTVNLHEPFPIAGRPGSNIIVDSFKRAWRNFVRVIASAIASLGIIIPVALAILVVAFVLRKLGLLPRVRWPRRDNRKPSDGDPPSAPPVNPS